MARFSTTLCPSEDPPPAKRLKTRDHCSGDDDDDDYTVDGRKGDGVPAWGLRRFRHVNSPTTSSCEESSSCSTPAYFDLDILDCYVCMEALDPPVFQCSNGHYACRECTSKMFNKCASCSEPVGSIRNLGLEKIIESIRVRCKYYNQGCSIGLIPFHVKKLHEARCLFAPHDCPLGGCSFHGALNSFKVHLMNSHNVRTHFFSYDIWFTVSLSFSDSYMLLEGENGTFFLFQVREEAFGKLVFISSFLPLDSDESYLYQMEVKIGNKRLTLASNIQTHAYNLRKLDSIDFLVIPQSFFSEEGFQVELTVKHTTKNKNCYLEPRRGKGD